MSLCRWVTASVIGLGIVLHAVGTPLLSQQPSAPASGEPASVSTLTQPAVARDLIVPAADLKPEQVRAMQKRLADWPCLACYREDDHKLGAPAPAQERVVFLGDSLTDNWGRRAGRFFPEMPWVNRGISGQTTPQMLLRFQQDVLSLQPQAVVVLAGTNDIAGNTGAETLDTIENNLRSMVELATQAHVRVVLSSVLPAAAFPWRPGVDPRAEIDALNQWMRSYAVQRHLTYLDYYRALAAADGSMKPGISMDGVHPNDAGYAIMEPLARKAVLAALAQPRP